MAVRECYPGYPAGADVVIAEHACAWYRRRVGRTAAARALSPETIDLAVRVQVRHRRTRYDGLLMRGAGQCAGRRA